MYGLGRWLAKGLATGREDGMDGARVVGQGASIHEGKEIGVVSTSPANVYAFLTPSTFAPYVASNLFNNPHKNENASFLG